MTRKPRIPSRQVVVALALAALVATAGCSSFLNSGDGDSSGGTTHLDSVPNDAEMVIYVDVDGMAGDESLRSIANTALEVQAEQSDYSSGPTSVSEMLAEFESESGLSPKKFDDVTIFGQPEAGASSSENGGMIVSSEFSEDELLTALSENGNDPSEQTYQGKTLYTYGANGEEAMAVLGDGTFAMGDLDAVESVLDVRAGDAQALQGDLRTEFEETDLGYVQFAMDVPQEQIPAEEMNSDAPVDTSAFNSVQYVSGSLSTSGDVVDANLNLLSESSDDASRTHDVLDGAISLYEGAGNDQIRNALEQVSVEQNGDTVSVSFTDDKGSIEEMITKLYSSS